MTVKPANASQKLAAWLAAHGVQQVFTVTGGTRVPAENGTMIRTCFAG